MGYPTRSFNIARNVYISSQLRPQTIELTMRLSTVMVCLPDQMKSIVQRLHHFYILLGFKHCQFQSSKHVEKSGREHIIAVVGSQNKECNAYSYQ